MATSRESTAADRVSTAPVRWPLRISVRTGKPLRVHDEDPWVNQVDDQPPPGFMGASNDA